MHIAVTRMEHVADRYVVLAANVSDGLQCLRDFCPRNNTVLYVVSRADAPDRSEGVLSPFPEQIPLFGRLSRADRARARSLADFRDGFGLLFHCFRQSL